MLHELNQRFLNSVKSIQVKPEMDLGLDFFPLLLQSERERTGFSASPPSDCVSRAFSRRRFPDEDFLNEDFLMKISSRPDCREVDVYVALRFG